ncbi:aldehyde dehydrogenase family protein [Streptomyces botrytidirepellens]|uniref:Aldehyde dehydrogenase family protein n=1 Tax=Streptomyces botrytidirepellens TaxID=2486417 RepID=A0A3M8VVX7_9ACTN|nr:aldehyde dehydrogenase family protein [Streptomyces botrytidirepellens]RNG20709.1 aldehyde dehydrogenase family protein [Streptomyces botrytidirepellens]
MHTHTPAYIGGKHLDGAETYDNIDPADGRSLGTVIRSGRREIDLAVEAARAAQPGWYATPVADRAVALTRLADAITAESETLARLESEDTGKPIGQARADAAVCARYFQFYGHAIDTYYGDTIPVRPGIQAYTTREPFGVTGHIVAWNYPMQLFARGVAPAIATGNCAVVKPADETPRTAVRLAELATASGIPDGVINIVPGIGAEAGAALTAHPDVRQVGFVGSTAVGAQVAHAAAERVVPATLELGGKSAHVVFPDADLDAAAEAVTKGILQNAGQTCSAGSRLIVHRDAHDALVPRLTAAFSAVRIGPGADDPDLGPLVSRKQQARVAGFLDGLTSGEVLVGGAAPDDPELGEGAYFTPTLVDGVDPGSRLAQEEVFGPVLAVMSFDRPEEAVRLANSTPYALMGAVWASDISRALTTARGIEAGQVYVNAFGAGGGVEFPFGGFRGSGYGREKGVEALDAYTQSKTFIIKL